MAQITIPEEMREFFSKFIETFKGLGFKSVNKFVLFLLRREIEKMIKEYPDIAKDIKSEDINENRFLIIKFTQAIDDLEFISLKVG
jgi:hypothetical protein